MARDQRVFLQALLLRGTSVDSGRHEKAREGTRGGMEFANETSMGGGGVDVGLDVLCTKVLEARFVGVSDPEKVTVASLLQVRSVDASFELCL